MKKLFKISLFGVSAILFCIIVLIALYYFTSIPEQQLNKWLGYYLPAQTGLKITIRKINRDLWRKIQLEGVSITRETKEKAPPICDIDSVDIEYSLRNLLLRNISISQLRISNININLPMDENNKISFFEKTGKTNDGKQPALPRIDIQYIDLRKANICLNRPNQPTVFELERFFGAFSTADRKISLRIDTLEASYPQKNLVIKKCIADLTMNEDVVEIATLGIQTDKSNIFLSGHFGKISSPDYRLSYNLSPVDLDEIAKLSGVALTGMAFLEGSIEGNFTDFKGLAKGNFTLFERPIRKLDTAFRFNKNKLYCDAIRGVVFEAPIAGDGFIDFGKRPETYGFKGTVSELNLQNIGPALYSSFSGAVDIKGEGFSQNTFKMAIDLQLSQADIDIYHFHEAIGGIDFDLKRLNFHPDFKARYKNTWSTFEGYLEYTGQLDVKGATVFGDLSDFKNQFFITDLDGRGNARFAATGLTNDFDIEGDFKSDSCRFYGLESKDFNVDLKLRTFISHKTGLVEGTFKNSSIYSVPVDSGSFKVSVAGDRYFLDDVYWQNINNKMAFSGLVDNTLLPPKFTADTLTVILWQDTVFSRRPLVMYIDTNKVEFIDFVLGHHQGKIDMTGTTTFENEMNLKINASNFEIAPIIKYLNFNKNLTGILSGKLGALGNFDSPILTADFAISNFVIDSTGLGNFDFQAQYKDKVVSLQSAKLQSDSSLFQLQGMFPANLSFTYEGKRLINEPFSAKFVAKGQDLPLLRVFVPSIEYLKGDYNALIDFSGTYNNPKANGSFALVNCIAKPLDIVDPITGINITGRLENDMVYVDNIEAYVRTSQQSFNKKLNSYVGPLSKVSDNRGKVTGNGTIKLLGIGLFDYNLKLSGKDCEFYADSYDIQGLADLNLTVTGSNPPSIGGTMVLKRLDMREQFTTFSKGVTPESEVLEDSSIWNLELEVSAVNNMWIKNSEADMELTGNVLVLRQAGIMHLLGQLDVLRGNFYLFNYKFKINTGQMAFNNISIIDPDINFEVTTRIRSSRNDISYDDLALIIGGTLVKPEIHSAGDSIHSDEDILKILLSSRVNLGTTGSKTGMTFTDNIMNNAIDYALQFSKSIERYNIIDELDIDPYSDSLGQTRISVAKYLSPKLFLRYSRGFSQDVGGSVGLEYMFNNNVSFEGRQGTGDEGISFDLNFKYEF